MDGSTTRVFDVRRTGYAFGAIVLLASAITVFVHVDAGWWVFPLFALGPDVAFLAGIGQRSGLQRGQMPTRAVPWYNALHRFYGPAALGLLAAAGALPAGLLVGSLVWGFHIAFDRAVGYGLRTRDGFQRT